jgi:hypothetical protein
LAPTTRRPGEPGNTNALVAPVLKITPTAQTQEVRGVPPAGVPLAPGWGEGLAPSLVAVVRQVSRADLSRRLKLRRALRLDRPHSAADSAGGDADDGDGPGQVGSESVRRAPHPSRPPHESLQCMVPRDSAPGRSPASPAGPGSHSSLSTPCALPMRVRFAAAFAEKRTRKPRGPSLGPRWPHLPHLLSARALGLTGPLGQGPGSAA